MILLANARFKKKNWYILLISLIAIYSCQNFPEKVSADHHISEVKKIDRNVIWTAMKRFQFSLIVDEIIQLHILFKVMVNVYMYEDWVPRKKISIRKKSENRYVQFFKQIGYLLLKSWFFLLCSKLLLIF